MTAFLLLLSIIAAVGALFWAWTLQRENERLTRRLDRYNKALFDLGDELRAHRDELAATSAELRVAIGRSSGTLRFTPEMTVREAQLVHPQVQQVLSGFHLGGCSDCAVEPDDTLGAVAASKGVALDQLLGTLNLLVTPSGAQAVANGGSYEAAGGAQAPRYVKLPNVALEL
ncbi:MAG: hypothetical protein ACRC1H_18635 [Caldilineaceae bacterium]